MKGKELAGVAPDPGLRPSKELLLGGVRRLPTLVSVVGTDCECDGYEGVWNFVCRLASGGGGSSKVGNAEAFGLLEVKLFASGKVFIEGGSATAVATLAF